MRTILKVLFLAADPFKTGARLELGEEMRAIDEAIQRGRARDGVELVSHFATRTRDLQHALLRHEPHIVHFAGHGGKSGVIYLGDEHGQSRAVPADALGRLFAILDGEVRAVVLNACHTLPVVEALSQVVDFAIGTNRPISDRSAIEFAAAFYGALAFGRGVRQAFDLAVNQLQLDGSRDADVPVLRTRAGTAETPLLPAAAGEAGAGGAAGRIRQDTEMGNVKDSDVDVAGNRRHGPGSGPASHVDQKTRIGTVTGSRVRISGAESGPLRRD